MIYRECKGKTFEEAHAHAMDMVKTDAEARIVHTRTEEISSHFGLKKEKIYKVLVAIPEYDLAKTRKEESVILPILTPPSTQKSTLNALEKEIIRKRAQLANPEPSRMAASIKKIAEKASLLEKEKQEEPPLRKTRPITDEFSLPFAKEEPSHMDDIISLKSELSELKKMMFTQKNGQDISLLQKEQNLPDDYEIHKQHLRWTEVYLLDREFDRTFINAFIKELEKDISILKDKNLVLAKAKEFLKASIPNPSINLDDYPYNTIILTGPTGVGKTCTIVKLAAHLGLTRKKSLRFLSIDRYKVGAESQLEKLAGYMKARFTSVTKKEEFYSLIAHKDTNYTFIDTSGKSPKESIAIEELALWLNGIKDPIDIHLVVSATTKNADLDFICKAYECLNYKHIIITKLDETKSYGSVLSMAFKIQKPFSFFTDGQEVPQDFSVSDLNKMISDSLS